MSFAQRALAGRRDGRSSQCGITARKGPSPWVPAGANRDDVDDRGAEKEGVCVRVGVKIQEQVLDLVDRARDETRGP